MPGALYKKMAVSRRYSSFIISILMCCITSTNSQGSGSGAGSGSGPTGLTMSHYPEQYKIGEDIQIECTNDGPNAPYQYDVIREGEASVSINGKDNSTSNIGIYTIQDSDKDGFTIRCYNKNFGLAVPYYRIIQSFRPQHVLKYIGISDEEELHLHITEEKLLNCSEYIYSRPPPSKIQWFRGSQFKQESAVYLLKTLDNSTEAEDLNCVYTASDWRSSSLTKSWVVFWNHSSASGVPQTTTTTIRRTFSPITRVSQTTGTTTRRTSDSTAGVPQTTSTTTGRKSGTTAGTTTKRTTRATTVRTTHTDPVGDDTMTTEPQVPVEGEDFIVRCQRSSQQSASFTYMLIDSNKEEVNIKSESGSAGVFIPQKKHREGFTIKCSDENNNLAVEREFSPQYIEALETDVVILDLNATDTVSLTCSDYIASRPPPNTFIWKADNITLGNSDSLTLNEKELFENLKKGVATVTCVSSNGVGKSVKVEWEVATILAQVSNSASVLITGSLAIIVYPILSLCRATLEYLY